MIRGRIDAQLVPGARAEHQEFGRVQKGWYPKPSSGESLVPMRFAWQVEVRSSIYLPGSLLASIDGSLPDRWFFLNGEIVAFVVGGERGSQIAEFAGGGLTGEAAGLGRARYAGITRN